MHKPNFITYSLITVFLLTSFVLLFSCSNSTEPEPGSREYTWEVDTLDIWASSFHGVYMSGPEDIWITNAGGRKYELMHYDGKGWKVEYIEDIYFVAGRIVGFEKNDIWLLPWQGGFQHYYRGVWTRFDIPEVETGSLYFNHMAKSDKNELYSVGQYSPDGTASECMISKYENGEWSLVEIPKLQGGFVNIAYDKSDGCFYIVSWEKVGERIYKFDGKNLICVFKGEDYNGSFEVQEINQETLLRIGSNLYEIKNQELKLICETDFTNSFMVEGRSIKDLFLITNEGLHHYNGTNLSQIFSYEYKNGGETTITENALCFVMREAGSSRIYVYRGVLKGEADG